MRSLFNTAYKPSLDSSGQTTLTPLSVTGHLLDLHRIGLFVAISLICTLFCANLHGDETQLDTTAQSAERSLPTLTTLRNQTRELLRKEALLPKGTEKDQAITALCDLYVVLRKDSRYAESEMLQQDAGKIRRRLLTSATKRKGNLRRAKVQRPSGLSDEVDAAINDAIKNSDSQSLDEHAEDPASSQDQAKSDKPNFGQHLGRAAGPGADNGWQLVELIERIVEPDFWETNGGPGAIHYFAMRRLLVVRATSDVHEQIREVLLKLPR